MIKRDVAVFQVIIVFSIIANHVLILYRVCKVFLEIGVVVFTSSWHCDTIPLQLNTTVRYTLPNQRISNWNITVITLQKIPPAYYTTV